MYKIKTTLLYGNLFIRPELFLASFTALSVLLGLSKSIFQDKGCLNVGLMEFYCILKSQQAEIASRTLLGKYTTFDLEVWLPFLLLKK